MSEHVSGRQSMNALQIKLRPRTDFRDPDGELLAALARQFDRARASAGGRLCVSAPGANEAEGTRAAVEALLHAAARHRETHDGTQLRVEIDEAHYSSDGYCHVFALCGAPAQERPQR